jgi:hypothetical protein
VTTDLPPRSAFRIHSPAGLIPPTSSTKMSASEEITSLILSVQRTLEGTQSTFFRDTLRLNMCVSSNVSFDSWQSSLATERPTVPKPASAIFNFLRAGFFLILGSSLFPDLDIARFAFAANPSPRSEKGQVSSSLKTARIIRYFGIKSRETDGLAGNATSCTQAESKSSWPSRTCD